MTLWQGKCCYLLKPPNGCTGKEENSSPHTRILRPSWDLSAKNNSDEPKKAPPTPQISGKTVIPTAICSFHAAWFIINHHYS